MDVGDSAMDTRGRVGERINWEVGIAIYTLLYIK